MVFKPLKIILKVTQLFYPNILFVLQSHDIVYILFFVPKQFHFLTGIIDNFLLKKIGTDRQTERLRNIILLLYRDNLNNHNKYKCNQIHKKKQILKNTNNISICFSGENEENPTESADESAEIKVI